MLERVFGLIITDPFVHVLHQTVTISPVVGADRFGIEAAFLKEEGEAIGTPSCAIHRMGVFADHEGDGDQKVAAWPQCFHCISRRAIGVFQMLPDLFGKDDVIAALGHLFTDIKFRIMGVGIGFEREVAPFAA